MKNHYIRKTTNALLLSTALGVMSALTPTTAMAQQYWDGSDTTSGNGVPTGGAGTWDAATTNWTDDALGTTNQTWAGVDAVFGGAAGGVVELEGNQIIDDITFSTSGYNITDAGGLAGNLQLTNLSIFTTDTGTSTTISATIEDGTGTMLRKNGDGTLTLSGNNTFTGGLTNFGGSGYLSLSHNNAAGTGTISASSFSTMFLSSGLTIANNWNLASGTAYINQNGGSVNLTGNISGNGLFRKGGSGEIILSGTNTNIGGLYISNGTISLQNGDAVRNNANVNIAGAGGILNVMTSETIGSLEGVGVVTIGAAQTLTAGGNNTTTEYSGLMSNAAGRFTKAGTGTMTFSGNNNILAMFSATGGTTVLTGENFGVSAGFSVQNGATLVANNTDGDAIANTTFVTVLGTGIFEVQTSEIIGAMSGSGNVFLNGANLIFGNGSNFNSTGVISGSGSLLKQGTGTQILAGANTYTGATYVVAGTMNVTGSIDSTVIGVYNAAQLHADANALISTAAITLNDTATFQNNGNNVIDRINSIAGTTVDLAGGSLTLSSASDYEIAGLITGTEDLIKDGAGILTLSGNNTYSGGTTIAGGTLSLQHNNAAGTGTITTTGSVIDYANGVNIANLVNINSNTTQLQVLTGSAEQSGIISETGGSRPLEKIGAGEMILTGANTYTGLTTISAGTLSLNGGAAIHDTGSVAIGASGTLNIMASETIAAMNNAGAINLQNGATGNNLILAGNYTGVGVINIDVNFGADMADQLIVGGNVTGTTSIAVNDISTGAATGNDILVVDVTGTSNAGDFTLAGGSIISGAYTYELSQIGVDWFLSEALSPLTATYEIYPQTLLALNNFSTMRQRTAGRVWRVATNGDNNNGNVWGIIEASHEKVTPSSSTTASTYDNTIWKMKAGVDGVVSENKNGKFIVGFNGYYGTAASNITSINGNGSIFTQGFGVGISGTYFSNDGFYVDGQLQASWNYSDLNSAASGALIADNLGQTYGASLEVGQKIDLGDGLAITPNAQLAYTSATFSGFDGPGGESVSLDYANSLIGRLGIIVENAQTWTGDDGTSNSSSVYGLANVYYNFSGTSQVDIAGTKLGTQPSKLSAEIGLGSSYDWNDGKYSLNAQASIASSLENMSGNYQYKGNLGFKAKF